MITPCKQYSIGHSVTSKWCGSQNFLFFFCTVLFPSGLLSCAHVIWYVMYISFLKSTCPVPTPGLHLSLACVPSGLKLQGATCGNNKLSLSNTISTELPLTQLHWLKQCSAEKRNQVNKHSRTLPLSLSHLMLSLGHTLSVSLSLAHSQSLSLSLSLSQHTLRGIQQMCLFLPPPMHSASSALLVNNDLTMSQSRKLLHFDCTHKYPIAGDSTRVPQLYSCRPHLHRGLRHSHKGGTSKLLRARSCHSLHRLESAGHQNI